MKDKACSQGMKPSQPNKEMMKSYKGSSALTQSVPQSIPSAKTNSASSPNWVATSFRWSNCCGACLTYNHLVVNASNILFRLKSYLFFKMITHYPICELKILLFNKTGAFFNYSLRKAIAR